MEDILVPIAVFTMVVGIVWLTSWSRAKTNAAIQKTVQKAIDKGVELNPDTIRALGVRERSQHSDLRGGLILIAIALGLIVLGSSVGIASGEEDMFAIMAGVAAIPGFIGLALLGMHFFIKKDNT